MTLHNNETRRYISNNADFISCFIVFLVKFDYNNIKKFCFKFMYSKEAVLWRLLLLLDVSLVPVEEK